MTNVLHALEISAPVGSLETYIAQVNQVPVLSAERESALFKKFRDDSDLEAAREIVLAHIRYVVRIARGYSGYGLPLSDLIQEGSIGLMKAVKRFDPDFGVRLVSFAVHWIKAEIHEYIIRNWRIVKIATTKAQRKLFFNLRSMKKRLGWFSPEEVQAVATDLGVTTQDVLAMEARLNDLDCALESHEDDGEHYIAPIHYLEAPAADPALQIEHADYENRSENKLADAMQQLDARSQDIITTRWLHEKKSTLHDLAAKYGVSAERIRQLEENALKKLKQFIHL